MYEAHQETIDMLSDKLAEAQDKVKYLEEQLVGVTGRLQDNTKLIEQMRVELKGFVDIMRILTRNSDRTSSNEFTNAMLVCIDRNELIIKDALSAAERGE